MGGTMGRGTSTGYDHMSIPGAGDCIFEESLVFEQKKIIGIWGQHFVPGPFWGSKMGPENSSLR